MTQYEYDVLTEVLAAERPIRSSANYDVWWQIASAMADRLYDTYDGFDREAFLNRLCDRKQPISITTTNRSPLMSKFEITIELPNGDWIYWTERCRDYQAAAESGIQSANCRGARLHNILKLTSPIQTETKSEAHS